eukprot:TRINITY_DN6672_c0_g1_i1.p2 TRINITY_DN6672_c0_g1~~TRINITY_DN6672_c0_g1_i1.p2  ORF type:complete len:289 (-),score=76.69 TRINITY_DN6672_c0_g1_i1:643-1509(-)
MAVYDVERDNMDAAAQVARASTSEKPLRHFLTAGATVMRYCVPAASRVEYLRQAVEATDAASTSPPTKLDGADDDGAMLPLSPTSKAAAKTERVAQATAAVAQVVAAHKAAAVASEAAAVAAAEAAEAAFGPGPGGMRPLDAATVAAQRQREEGEIARARQAAAAASAAMASELGSMGADDGSRISVCPELRSRARLHLALGEAYCDTLNVEAAEEPLQRAMELMGECPRRARASQRSSTRCSCCSSWRPSACNPPRPAPARRARSSSARSASSPPGASAERRWRSMP